MADYTGIFTVAVLLCALITFRSSDAYKRWCGSGRSTKDMSISEEDAKAHASLLRRYIIVYLLATASDWLQGPFVYALYTDYGFEREQIAQLFVAGFGSSMIFGSFIGGMADAGGRRKFVMIYAIVYIASCLTKHFKNYWILMLGRLLGGVSTSLLFSVFEAWLIRSHSDADLPKHLLSKSFSVAAFGNSVIAILAGLIGNKIAESEFIQVGGELYVGKLLNPFDLAILCLTACALIARFTWQENYGQSDSIANEKQGEGKGEGKWYSGIKDAFIVAARNREILLCGIISSFFEGSMYIFVFMWTPLLKSFLDDPKNGTLPYGLIFSTFMVFCMTGSSLFSILVSKYSVEKLGVGIFAVGALAMLSVGLHTSDTVAFLGMNLFEICVGMYFPIMGTMKGSIVPESKRAAIYNLYRIPLNFIVVSLLLIAPEPTVAFIANFVMMTVATFLQVVLTVRRTGRNEATERSSLDENDESVSLINPESNAV